MRGRRTAVAALLLTALTTGCDEAGDATPEADAAPVVSVAVPEFDGDLDVRLVTGVQSLGLGCRQRTEQDACSADGRTTYTWLDGGPGNRRSVTVTGARMRLTAERTDWVVAVRFARTDRGVVRRVARHAVGSRGFALVLDGRTGSALQAAPPESVEGGRIVVRGLTKGVAWDLVSAYVTAATPR